MITRERWLTPEERALPFEYHATWGTHMPIRFTAERTDLLDSSVVVHAKGRTDEEIAAACFEFGLWWRMDVHRRLNGHAGVGEIRWEVHR